MTTTRLARSVRGAMLAALVGLSACGGGADAAGGTPIAFVDALTRDYSVDYDAFPSLDAAVDAADAVVVGRFGSASEGITVRAPNDSGDVFQQFTTFACEVDEVISGDVAAGDRIVLQIARSPVVPVADIAGVLPAAPAILVLEDLSGWTPFAGAVFEYPAGIDASTRIFSPYPDGLWLKGAGGDLVGYFAGPEDVAARWALPTDFAALRDGFRAAAAS